MSSFCQQVKLRSWKLVRIFIYSFISLLYIFNISNRFINKTIFNLIYIYIYQIILFHSFTLFQLIIFQTISFFQITCRVLYIINTLTKKKRIKMIVKDGQGIGLAGQRCRCDDIESKIMQVINMYGLKDKINNIYLDAPMDSLIGFKIQLKFIKTYLVVKGYLLYTNGCPVTLPQLYLGFIFRKFYQMIEIPMQFQYSRSIGTLIFQSSMKLGDQITNRIPLIVDHVKIVIKQLPFIYQQLSNFGIVKKFNLRQYKLIKNKLRLIQNIIKTLHNNQQQVKNQMLTQNKKSQNNKQTVFKFYKQIQQIENKNTIVDIIQSQINKQQLNLLSNNQNIRTGGYFQIQKKKCQITQINYQLNSQTKFVTELAVKKLRKDKLVNQVSQNKLKKQLRILQQIQNPSHTLTYWLKYNGNTNSLDTNNKIYMEYVEDSLDDCIYGKQNSIEDILKYSKQLIKAVDILHRSGVVHRDLKPDNILVQKNKINNNSQQKNHVIKLIDFGQSCLRSEKYSKKVGDTLGSTLPYSPIECYISCEQAFNSPEIDLWSVGLILYEIYNKKNPISYSRCFSTEIYVGWTTTGQFSIYPDIRKKKGIKIISNVFTILSLNSVCVKQEQRISLHQMDVIISFVNNFINKLEEI